jgi:O-antigen/teichoic acid export membrane protein
VGVVGILLSGPIADFIFDRPLASAYLVLGAAGVILSTGSSFANAMLLATDRVAGFARVQTTGAVLYLFGVVLLSLAGRLNVGSVVLLAAGIPVLVFPFAVRHLPAGFFVPSEVFSFRARQQWAPLVLRSKWLWAASLLALLSMQLDLILLSHWAPATAVGVYALASGLASRLDLVNQTRFLLLLPRVAKLRPGAELDRFARGSIARSLLLSLPYLLVVPLAGPFVATVYGPSYADSVPLLIGLLTVLLVDIFTQPLFLLAYPLDAPDALAWSNGVRVLVLLAAGVLLIPVFGPMGAVAAKLTSRLAGAGFAYVIFSRRTGRRSRLGRPGEPDAPANPAELESGREESLAR